MYWFFVIFHKIGVTTWILLKVTEMILPWIKEGERAQNHSIVQNVKKRSDFTLWFFSSEKRVTVREKGKKMTIDLSRTDSSGCRKPACRAWGCQFKSPPTPVHVLFFFSISTGDAATKQAWQIIKYVVTTINRAFHSDKVVPAGIWSHFCSQRFNLLS